MGFIRNTLRAQRDDGQGYKCDLVMGVPEEFELAIPYLNRVRLDGAFSNQALLSAGWANMAIDQFERAVAAPDQHRLAFGDAYFQYTAGADQDVDALDHVECGHPVVGEAERARIRAHLLQAAGEGARTAGFRALSAKSVSLHPSAGIFALPAIACG